MSFVSRLHSSSPCRIRLTIFALWIDTLLNLGKAEGSMDAGNVRLLARSSDSSTISTDFSPIT